MRSGKTCPECVVLSGKGGTGKTSLTASLALLERSVVLADCDVDAADLHLLLQPEVQEEHPFISGHEAVISSEACLSCGLCQTLCRFEAIVGDRSQGYRVDPVACEGCGVCVSFCPQKAVDFPESDCGVWRVSRTRAGAMVHAHLHVGAENSGKLVSVVRNRARELALEEGAEMILVDGPPGIGCPVISSLAGATLALVVSEPTVSGKHDLERVLDLCRHFSVPAALCLNKWDLNPDMSDHLEKMALERGYPVLGRLPWDSAFNRAQIQGLAVVEMPGVLAETVSGIHRRLQEHLAALLREGDPGKQ